MSAAATAQEWRDGTAVRRYLRRDADDAFAHERQLPRPSDRALEATLVREALARLMLRHVLGML